METLENKTEVKDRKLETEPSASIGIKNKFCLRSQRIPMKILEKRLLKI